MSEFCLMDYQVNTMKRFLVISLFLCSFNAFAAITTEGGGVIYGDSHVYALQAPKGWVLDNESGASQGIYAIFYPVGKTPNTTDAFAYSQGIVKQGKIQNIPSFVEFTINNFISDGNPNYAGKFQKKIENKDKSRMADIYFYQGDQWGNYEAVAYFDEDKTINMIVFNSHSKSAFDASLAQFYELVSSYVFISDGVQSKN